VMLGDPIGCLFVVNHLGQNAVQAKGIGAA
jgi:hypothetical protein